MVLKCLLQGNPATDDFHRTRAKVGKSFSILMVFLIMSFLDISFCALDYVEVGTNTHTSRWHTCQTPIWYGVDLVYFTPFCSQHPFPFYALLSQKLAPAEKNSTGMSAASAAFCISACGCHFSVFNHCWVIFTLRGECFTLLYNFVQIHVKT